ncbi:MAG: hypothetical protein AUH29_14300 [Candidatus Rokubacteria bacterium 13_1_40CM_69_27]|nr:MAG: hypothetical protein AUH29_14300 [Candidatus Rokubacteria bacterium 13_1_40CM_69_27]OLC30605.1 MAG: hypothetical protein AUH81_19605 [Candidatus Rokubacteria bacterium 13_1_40CM_4_69_5]OLE39429.1 MAG: hypothetical protein AUG00_02155 [Candidatus Rokubacteria bacterium 13_1_20CM_2_70_7]
MAEQPTPEEVEARKHWRRMKRQDTGLDLFQRAEANLGDLERLKPILLELSRLYNPLVNGPLVDRTTYARIIESAETGRIEEARQLLDARLALYVVQDRAPDVPPACSTEGGSGTGRSL